MIFMIYATKNCQLSQLNKRISGGSNYYYTCKIIIIIHEQILVIYNYI